MAMNYEFGRHIAAEQQAGNIQGVNALRRRQRSFNTAIRQGTFRELPLESPERRELVIRIGTAIEKEVESLQEASLLGLPLYHKAIVDLDHILLTDIISNDEAVDIILRSETTGVLAKSQQLYGQYETFLEESFVNVILHSGDIDLLDPNNITQNYLMRYRNLTANEVALADIKPEDRVLFIGSGPLPISAIEIARQTGCQIDCVEHFADKADTSRAVIDHLGMSGQVHVYTAEGQEFPVSNYSVILVGVLAQPKQEIINHIEQNTQEGVRVLARTTEGIREFIYPEAEFTTSRFIPRDINHAVKDQTLSTILLKDRLIDASKLIPKQLSAPLRIIDDGEAYVSNITDPQNHWLYYAFEGFNALSKQGKKIGHFVSIATGPGVDAIGAMEILHPERITVTDLVSTAIDQARENISRYQELGERTPVTYVVGNLCEPLGNDTADVIYANLPNIPIPTELLDQLLEGITAASYFDPETLQGVPEDLGKYLLSLQYAFLQQAKSHLTPDGQVLLNLGARMPITAINDLFDKAGYQQPEVLSFGFKLQTEPFDTIPNYAAHETSEVQFAYYPYRQAKEILTGKSITNFSELTTLLEQLKLSATDAFERLKQGEQLGHLVTLLSAKPK